jgi:uncharacterized membrane protein
MRQLLTPGLLWFSAIGCGLLAGLYFAFSTFVMTALARLGQTQGIAAMNSINVEIVRSLFMPLFLGTTLTSTALAVLSFFHWGEPRRNGNARWRRRLWRRHVHRHDGVQRAAQ